MTTAAYLERAREIVAGRFAAYIVVLLAILAASTGVSNGFALDDVHLIFENARVHSIADAWRLFGQTYWPPEEGASLYRPLTMLAFTVQWSLGNGSPLPFHIVSILLYAGGALALHRLMLAVAGRDVALLAAAIFAVHPLHVEAVANVVGQAELWVALIAFASVSHYIRARNAGTLRGHDIAVLALLYAAACMFKEHAIILPALFAVAELTVVRDQRARWKRAQAAMPVVIMLIIVAVAFVAARTAVVGEFQAAGSNELFRDQSFVTRLFTMLRIVIEWVRLFFWPAALSADYSSRRTEIATSFQFAMLPGILVILGCGVIAHRLRRSTPEVTFGILWIAVTLAIPSNLFLVTGFVLAERTLFLASAGVALCIAAGVVALWRIASERNDGTRRLVAVAVTLVLVAGVARSMSRNPVWKDNDTLFRQTVMDVPSSSRAHWMLAEHLAMNVGPRAGLDEMLLAVVLGRKNDPTLLGFAADQFSVAGLCPRAMGMYRTALALTPDNVQLRINSSLCLLRLGKLDEARTLAVAGMPKAVDDTGVMRIVTIADSLVDVRRKWLASTAR